MDGNVNYTVYIDEAGDLGIKRGTKWFIISAVIVPISEEPSIRSTLSAIKTKFNIKDIHSSFYMRLMVEDTPGVLAQVGLILANNGISVSSALQRESSIECNGCVPLVFMTHDVIGSQIINAVKEIDSQPFIKEKTVIIRVEGN